MTNSTCCEKCRYDPGPNGWFENAPECDKKSCPCHTPTLQREGEEVCVHGANTSCYVCERAEVPLLKDNSVSTFPISQQADEWELNFEKQFGHFLDDVAAYMFNPTIGNSIKDFFRSTLKQEKEKARKEGYEEGERQGQSTATGVAIKAIKVYRESLRHMPTAERPDILTSLDDILTIIRKHQEK